MKNFDAYYLVPGTEEQLAQILVNNREFVNGMLESSMYKPPTVDKSESSKALHKLLDHLVSDQTAIKLFWEYWSADDSREEEEKRGNYLLGLFDGFSRLGPELTKFMEQAKQPTA